MKSVFAIEFSRDGLNGYVFSNIKALHNCLEKAEGYDKVEIYTSSASLAYNYANLCKAIRQQQAKNTRHMGTIYCQDGMKITITELSIATK